MAFEQNAKTGINANRIAELKHKIGDIDSVWRIKVRVLNGSKKHY